MNREEFLLQLRRGLSGLPEEDIEERLNFYSEMIADRMEDGVSEEAAVAELGSVDALVSRIIEDIPLTRLVKEKITPKRKPGAWEIVLLVLGSPIWISLLIAAFAVLLSLYAVLWSVVIVLWTLFAALAACALALSAGGVFFALKGTALTGLAVIGAGAVCAGLSIFMFFGCRAVTKGILFLTKKLARFVKRCFMKKEAA